MKLLLSALMGACAIGTPTRHPELDRHSAARVTRSFESSLTLKVDELTLQHDASGEQLNFLWCDATLVERRRTVLIDEAIEMPPPDPSRLVRKFETIEFEQNLDVDNRTNDDDSHERVEAHGRLEGKRIRLARGEDGSCIAAFEDEDDADVQLLRGLELEADLRQFLPDGKEELSGTREVEASALRSMFDPGGQLEFVDPNGNPVESFHPGFSRALEGRLRVDSAGERELEDGLVTVMRVQGKIQAVLPASSSSGEVQLGLGYTAAGTNTVTTKLDLDVSGEILWNPKVHRLHSAHFDASVRFARVTHGEIDGPSLLKETWVRETWGGCLTLNAAVSTP